MAWFSISFFGLYYWKPREIWFKYGAIVSIAIILWFTSSWVGGMGDTFGYRYLVQSTPVFIVGLASFYNFIEQYKNWNRASLLISGFMVSWGILSLLQSAFDRAPPNHPWTWYQVFFGKWDIIVDFFG